MKFVFEISVDESKFPDNGEFIVLGPTYAAADELFNAVIEQLEQPPTWLTSIDGCDPA